MRNVTFLIAAILFLSCDSKDPPTVYVPQNGLTGKWNHLWVYSDTLMNIHADTTNEVIEFSGNQMCGYEVYDDCHFPYGCFPYTLHGDTILLDTAGMGSDFDKVIFSINGNTLMLRFLDQTSGAAIPFFRFSGAIPRNTCHSSPVIPISPPSGQ